MQTIIKDRGQNNLTLLDCREDNVYRNLDVGDSIETRNLESTNKAFCAAVSTLTVVEINSSGEVMTIFVDR